MRYFIIVMIIISAFGCRTARKVQTPVTRNDTIRVTPVQEPTVDSAKLIKDVFAAVRSREIAFKTFSAKIKVDYTNKNGKGPDLTVFVRMQKDSAIWLSLNATVFSYEAFRVLITPDSIKVLNKKDKSVQLRPVSFLRDLVQLPINFSTLQDLIIGNPVYLDSNIVSYTINESLITMLCTGTVFRHLMTLNRSDYRLQHSRLDDVNTALNRTCDLTYTGYTSANGVPFSTGRKIVVSEKSKLDVDLDFKQYTFNETLSMPFTIPKNYKRN